MNRNVYVCGYCLGWDWCAGVGEDRLLSECDSFKLNYNALSKDEELAVKNVICELATIRREVY